MSIPLDRLYNYLDDLNNCDILIYRFFPHGSKNLNDLTKIQLYPHLTPLEADLAPVMVCHDQEPLDYNFYQSVNVSDLSLEPTLYKIAPGFPDHPMFKELVDLIPRLRLRLPDLFNFHDKLLLCHSEKNSPELEKFSSNFIGVYYWSHAIIARDWFRYAEYDPVLQHQNYKYDFLIYNRAWSGTREYRLKFVELLTKHGLQQSCLTSFSSVDDKHYTEHIFKNPNLSINATGFEHLLPSNTYKPCASADYTNSDYVQCGIEVVLETLFDDQRLHLTEKTLRPIACGKPFILASTPGSLQYLRDYGFETFEPFINETYDTIADPLERLCAIIKEMHRITQLSNDQKADLYRNLNQIAQRNKKLFFSDAWQKQIVDEYISNRDQALVECRKHRNGKWRINASKILLSQGIEQPFTDYIMKILSVQDPA